MLVGPSFYMSIRKKKKNEVNRLEPDEASLYMHFNILTSFDLDTFFLERCFIRFVGFSARTWTATKRRQSNGSSRSVTTTTTRIRTTTGATRAALLCKIFEVRHPKQNPMKVIEQLHGTYFRGNTNVREASWIFRNNPDSIYF